MIVRRLLQWTLLAALTVVLSAPLHAVTVGVDDSVPLPYTAGSGAQALSTTATLTGAFTTTGEITVSFVGMSTVAGEDLLQILAVSPISVASGAVRLNGTQLGTYSGGAGGLPLVIDLDNNVSAADIEILLRHLAYHNVAGSGATPSPDRVVQIQVQDDAGTVSANRTVQLAPGNALPAITLGPAMALTRCQRRPFTPTEIQASDADHGPAQLTYQVETLPQHGSLILAVTDPAGDIVSDRILGGGFVRFTQADINANRLRYEHDGSAVTGDSFSVEVSDPLGATTPVTPVSISIAGTAVNPAITLPVAVLSVTEDDVAFEVMESTAPTPLTITVSGSDAPHYRGAALEVRLVDTGGADAGTSGDTLAVRSQIDAAPPAIPGFITVISTMGVRRIYIRHVGDTSALPTAGTPSPPDYLLGTIDAIDDGVQGRPLLIHLASTIIMTTQDQAPAAGGDRITSEAEVVTPDAVALLIANLTAAYPGDTPPVGQRLLRVRLSEASPNPGVGTATRPITVIAVNDPPVFTPNALALDAMVGVPLIGNVVAIDPDLPAGSQLTYTTSTLGFTLAADGSFRHVPTTVGSLPVLITADDGAGGISNQLTMTINAVSGPTASRPYVTTDPPVEIGEGEIIFHPFTINPARGVPSNVLVTLLGDVPGSAAVNSASLDKLTWTLTAPGVVKPADGIYTFGLRLELVYPTGGNDVGWQPITLVVRSVGGTN